MRHFHLASLDRRHVYLVGLATILIFGFGLVLLQPAFALTISPVRMEISGDPGQTLHGTMELLNEQEDTKTFYASAQNFEARGDAGVPYFLSDTSTGLASWISVQESVNLKSGERKKIPFSITIPQNAEAGGYFAAILWGTSPNQQRGGQVSIGGKLGMLILLSVRGDVEEGGGLLDFKIDDGGRFVNSLPITFVYRFSNDGGERIKPSGEIKIKNLFGFTSATLDANSTNGNILPGSIRKFSAVWQEKGQVIPEPGAPLKESAAEPQKQGGFFSAVKHQWRNFALGPYKAELNLTYGALTATEATDKAEASYRFFVIPWQLLSIIIVVLAIVGFLGFVGLKKYNRWVIKKARTGKLQ